jgi:uroporphyrinogen III methyltransferase/synthase
MTGNKNKGKVYLVGAGPGRPDLITVRGAEVLETADCVICDRLVNPALLKFARRDAEIIDVPKRVGQVSFSQDEINKLLIGKASSGQTVVRLKGGDPCIFGKVVEEAAALAEAGIDFEIVPGITAGIAVGAYAGMAPTDREHNSQVIFVTGQEAEGKQKSSIDWHLLAGFSGTIIFYMAMSNLDFIADELIKNGMNQKTPAAAVADVSLPSQRVVTAPIADISEECRRQKIGPPAIVVIGRAAEIRLALNWFMKKPLFGKTIVVTRDRTGNARFATKIISEGGNPVEFATIKIEPLTQTNQFIQTLAKITEFDWMVFTSTNGVDIFFEALKNLGKDARVLGSAKIAAIGSRTADRLAKFGIKADFVPNVFTGRELGKQSRAFANLKGKRVLLLRSQAASNELIELLVQGGAEVTNTVIYNIAAEKNDYTCLKQEIADGKIDWLTFASASSVNRFFEQIGSDVVNAGSVKVASIGPATSEQLKKHGVKIEAEAAEHTIDGLLAAIKKASDSFHK